MPIPTLCVLEWIEEYLGLNDADMNVIVPLFNNLAGDVARIEEIAKQVNWAASQNEGGSFQAIRFLKHASYYRLHRTQQKSLCGSLLLHEERCS